MAIFLSAAASHDPSFTRNLRSISLAMAATKARGGMQGKTSVVDPRAAEHGGCPRVAWSSHDVRHQPARSLGWRLCHQGRERGKLVPAFAGGVARIDSP